jgi:ADP-heptose:LPS heptosyltransferase
LSAIKSPYLLADTDRSDKLRAKLKTSEKLVCGISWISKNADHGEGKSLSLEALNPVLHLSGFDFVSLQYGETAEERDAFIQQHGVKIHHVDEIDNQNDLDGLAALIGACDIVVTVSNTTAHLAAALGKPVIVMLPNNDALFWYWHRDSHTTPWYPTVRLFRRSDTGRWEDVIDAVAMTLAGIQ